MDMYEQIRLISACVHTFSAVVLCVTVDSFESENAAAGVRPCPSEQYTGTHVQYYKYAYIFHLHYASFSLFLLSDSWRLRGIARVVVVLYASYPLSTLVYFI